MKALLALIVLAISGWAAEQDGIDPKDPPAFCGVPEKHHVIKQSSDPSRLQDGKARIYILWQGLRWRTWFGQCKVALNGSWVAVLSINSYTYIDVEPGKLRFCAAGSFGRNTLAPTWRSLMFLNATAGDTHYVECSPGGDELGAPEPTLSELDEKAGQKIVSKSRRVTFTIKKKE